jgi:hypothetical protein
LWSILAPWERRMDPIAVVVFGLPVLYLATGLLVAIGFVIFGVTAVQSAPVSVGARILLVPGATALWPVVLSRWLKARRVP